MVKMMVALLIGLTQAAIAHGDFVYNVFRGSDLSLDGAASFTSDGLLMLTNATKHEMGHAFFPSPINFRTHPNGQVLSFSTTFVFAIAPEIPLVGGMGLAFVISPSKDFSTAFSSQFLGLFNVDNNGRESNHVVAVEFDTLRDADFRDIDGNHVGIDVNGLVSISSKTAGFYDGDGGGHFRNITLLSGQAVQAWVEYDSSTTRLRVTVSPFKHPKPSRPLLSSTFNLSSIIFDSMYIGFSSSVGSIRSLTYLLGWSFAMNETAPPPLNLSALPQIPPNPFQNSGYRYRESLRIALLSSTTAGMVVIVSAVASAIRALRRKKYAELIDDWEMEYGPQRFSYKDLYKATGGFRDENLLGVGGFGRVYRGLLPSSKAVVAIKRVSHDSWQGTREFVAEITSIGRLRHRNLVQLLGYCRREKELLLVYDFMPNGSLDRRLFRHVRDVPPLSWQERMRIVRGVCLGLLYLHEDWDKVVVHRDVKASNVLLDGELNGRLGDFGLARLYDRGEEESTTRVVGTVGYMAPELARVRRPSTRTDVYAFGAFVLEVACGRRPVETDAPDEEVVLTEWVMGNWRKGGILESMDGEMRGQYKAEEGELVLKLGLLCAHPGPEARPSMRQVLQVLQGDVPMPELTPEHFAAVKSSGRWNKDKDWSFSVGSHDGAASVGAETDSILWQGR